MMLKRIFIIFLLFSTVAAYASLTLQMSGIYNTDEDDSSNFAYNKMHYQAYIGGSFGSSNRFYIGQNIGKYTRSHEDNGSTANEMDLLELGPKFLWYLHEMKTWFVSLTWNPYARGTRTDSTGEVDLIGSSYMATLGYHARVSRRLGIGVSLNYHSLAIEKTELNNSTTEVSQTYSSVTPMLEIAFHFK